MDQQTKIPLVKILDDEFLDVNADSGGDFGEIGATVPRLHSILAETRKPEPIIVVHCRLVESLEKLILELER